MAQPRRTERFGGTSWSHEHMEGMSPWLLATQGPSSAHAALAQGLGGTVCGLCQGCDLFQFLEDIFL